MYYQVGFFFQKVYEKVVAKGFFYLCKDSLEHFMPPRIRTCAASSPRILLQVSGLSPSGFV